MVARVSQRLNEASGPGFYPRSEIVAALNEAHRFFVLLTLGLETTAAWTIPPQTSLTAYHMLGTFPDWIVPLRVTTSTGAKVRPARLEDLAGLDSGWMATTTTADPTRYVALGADLVVPYPLPLNGSTLQVTYARAGLPLANDADVPETPAEYHPAYVEYGVYRLRQVEGGQEFQKVLPELGAYLKAAQQYAAYVRSRNMGSRYDKIPFELELFDRSKLLGKRKDLVPARKVEDV